MEQIWKNGQKILFYGDSITDCDRKREDPLDLGHGYPAKIAGYMQSIHPERNLHFINRGISGDRVRDLLTRYRDDVLVEQPDFISILVGINESWFLHEANDPTPPETFKFQYETLLKSIKTDLPHTKLMLIEPFLLPVNPDREGWRNDLEPRIRDIRRLACKYADYYLPLDGILWAKLVDTGTATAISYDGVHPTDEGHAFIARNYLKLMGEL